MTAALNEKPRIVFNCEQTVNYFNYCSDAIEIRSTPKETPIPEFALTGAHLVVISKDLKVVRRWKTAQYVG